MAHYAHYVRREVVNYRVRDAPWFAKQQLDDQGFVAPTYHVTRATRGAAARVAPGDTIWLFSQLRTPWRVFPPAVDAKIVVSNVVRLSAARGRSSAGFEFVAGEGSTWLPLWDARPSLALLETIDARGRRSRLFPPHSVQPLGRVLQSMRQLADAAPLLALEQSILLGEYDFISYRLVDGTRGAFAASYQLVCAGRPVWWDRWSLPRRLAERREVVNDVALERFIHSRIAASKRVFGIASPKYAEAGSYSQREMELAASMDKFQLWSAGTNPAFL